MTRYLAFLLFLPTIGYAGKHFVVCMATSAGAGCSHEQFTKAEATKIGKILASQPLSEDIQVWLEDKSKPAYPATPHGTEPPSSSNDTKL